ncbi:hypothetical protein FHG87_020496 [Trinorchestia longiramus]|nr:hypothetical protein FHG87_020496 [Trinorchestia longiramus]
MIMRKQIAAETGGPLQQPLPDVGPLLPYIGAVVVDNYDHQPTQYVTSNTTLHPHTVHLHHNAPALYSPYSVGLNLHQLTALTLVNLYAHALTYAVTSKAKIDSAGHLETPIVVQGVHSHVNMIQPAVFQLNTIGPHCYPLLNTSHFDTEQSEQTKMADDAVTKMAALPQLNKNKMVEGSGVRNVFFYRAFDKLYLSCEYDNTAKPSLKGVNYDLVSLLRAMHEA